MKRALKIIVPILLALVLLGSIGWYLLIYDRDFTQDMLLRCARYQENQGNHSSAAFLYNLAYDQSSQDDSVAIELADQFKAIGNYTKAEYTLSNAIEDGGSAELYIALCKTYVEQDKLLDAVTMLENITDPVIKAELDAIRPAMPTAAPEAGFYTQYITVELDAPSGSLYVTTDGEYPSSASAPYSEALTLPAGETTIYALAVGNNGLVSKLAVYGYTVGGVIEQVEFTDSAMEQTVRSILAVSEDKVLYSDDLWTVTELEVPAEAESYEDLALMPYLKTLTIHDGNGDLTILSSLTQLEELDLSGSKLSTDDVAAIGTLTNLKKLDLSGCGLSSISGLVGNTALTHLDLSENTIRNIEPIASMASLQELSMPHNALVDLQALSGLNYLQKLDVSYNALTSLSPITACASLTDLKASNNDIAAIDGMNKLNNLTELDTSYNKLTDISPLASCPKLTTLNISNNALTDISPLSTLVSMMEFDFSYNQVTALPQWPAESQLVYINGSNNRLESIDGLKGFQMLNMVYMDYNLLTSVDALAECPRLVQVNVYGNEIPDVSALTDMSVIVNYNPVQTEEEE